MGLPTLFRTDNQASILYGTSLSSYVRFRDRIPDPSFALRNDPNAFEMVLRDDTIAMADEVRRTDVAGSDWRYDPPTDTESSVLAAAIMESLTERIEHFAMARSNLAGAYLRGGTWARIYGEWRLERYGDGRLRRWWTPAKLKDIHKHRVEKRRERVCPDCSPSPKCRVGCVKGRWKVVWELYSIEDSKWKPIVRPEWFVRHVYGDREETLGYGTATLDSIYYSWWAKNVLLDEALNAAERWGMGMIYAKIDGLRAAAKTGNIDDEVDNWLDTLDKLRARHSLVFDSKDEINRLDGPGQGWQLLKELIDRFDRIHVQRILGSLRPTGSQGETGSFAQAKTEQETQGTIIAYDRMGLDESIDAGLAELLWRVNGPNFRALGILDANRPRFRIGQERNENPDQFVDRALKVLTVAPIGRQTFYERAGVDAPKPGEEVIEPIAAAPGIPGLGGA